MPGTSDVFEKYLWRLNSGTPVPHGNPIKIDPISHYHDFVYGGYRMCIHVGSQPAGLGVRQAWQYLGGTKIATERWLLCSDFALCRENSGC